jgi:outer membrane protein
MSGKIFMSFILFLGISMTTLAQQVAVVDVAGILESMDEYKAAQQELDRVAATWQQEIAQEYDKIKSLYNKYQAEQVLLSDEMKTQREEEIMTKEKQVRELQKQKFGADGELFNKRQQLVSPVQDRVYSAIEAYAEDRSIDLIFDKSSATGLIFANEKYDKTSEIKKRLGM